MISPATNRQEIETVISSFDAPGKGIRSQVGVIIRRSVNGSTLYVEDRKGKRTIALTDAVDMVANARMNWTHYQEVKKAVTAKVTTAQIRTPHCCGQPMTKTVMGWVCDECDSVR